MPPSMGRIAPVMNAGDEPRLVAAARHGRLGDLFGLADLAHRHGGGCAACACAPARRRLSVRIGPGVRALTRGLWSA